MKIKLIITIIGILVLIGIQIIITFNVRTEFALPLSIVFVFIYMLYPYLIKKYLFKQ